MKTKKRPASRRGQALVEFAIIALVLYMLLAAMLTFGHLLYVAQGLQGAADLAAREIAHTPFDAMVDDAGTPRALTFEDLTEFHLSDDPASQPVVEPSGAGTLRNNSDLFRRQIFDEAYLVIDLDMFFGSPAPDGGPRNLYRDLVPELPLVNRQLVPYMIVEDVKFWECLDPDPENPGAIDPDPDCRPVTRRMLRYPGALLDRERPIRPPAGLDRYPDYVADDLVVGIPLVVDRGPAGVETIRWVPIIEEIEPADENHPGRNPFRIVDADQITNRETRGIVALRINYPFQSAAMSSFRRDPLSPEFPFESTVGRPNVAADGVVNELNPQDRPGGLRDPELTPLVYRRLYTGTYGGRYGLGAQGALGSMEMTGMLPVRPYRRVISSQAIYRREIFQ